MAWDEDSNRNKGSWNGHMIFNCWSSAWIGWRSWRCYPLGTHGALFREVVVDVQTGLVKSGLTLGHGGGGGVPHVQIVTQEEFKLRWKIEFNSVCKTKWDNNAQGLSTHAWILRFEDGSQISIIKWVLCLILGPISSKYSPLIALWSRLQECHTSRNHPFLTMYSAWEFKGEI